jgi:predicted TIM-barrel fold metal-dependent hydrolase
MKRFREIASIIILPIIIVAALLAPAYVTYRVNQVQLAATCQNARSNAQQLEALKSIAMDLGIPVRFTIPPPPPGCDGR